MVLCTGEGRLTDRWNFVFAIVLTGLIFGRGVLFSHFTAYILATLKIERLQLVLSKRNQSFIIIAVSITTE